MMHSWTSLILALCFYNLRQLYLINTTHVLQCTHTKANILNYQRKRDLYFIVLSGIQEDPVAMEAK